jgi:hypothetical protein
MKYHWRGCEMMMMMTSGRSSTDAIHIKATTIFLKRPHIKIMLEEGRKINIDCRLPQHKQSSPVKLDLFSTAQIQRSQQG